MKITRETLATHLFSQQLEIAGKTIQDVVNDDRWKFNITITREQFLIFNKYSIKTIQRVLRIPKSKAEDVFNSFYKDFGVRIKD
jgi:hypothetical protein